MGVQGPAAAQEVAEYLVALILAGHEDEDLPLLAGTDGCCSPRHHMHLNSRSFSQSTSYNEARAIHQSDG